MTHAMTARVFALAALVALPTLKDCMGDDSGDAEAPRVIKIQIEGCKEAPAPSPGATLALAMTSGSAGAAAVAHGTAGVIAAAATATPATVALAAVVPSQPPVAASQAYYERVEEVRQMLDEHHLSRLDLPEVDQAMRRADEEAAAEHYDEASRQLAVAETAVRTTKIGVGVLDTKIRRLSAAIEDVHQSNPARYAKLMRDLQDANTALTEGRNDVAVVQLWKIENRLDELQARPRNRH